MATKKIEPRAGRVTIVIEQGATFDPIMTWSTKSTGVPIDLTGYSARMKIKSSIGGTLLHSMTSPVDIILGGVAGTIQLFIDDATTEAFTFKRGVYDLELESPTGKVTRLLQGSVQVKQETTD